MPTAVTPDGLRLIFTETFPNTSDDVMQMMLDGTRRLMPLVQSPFVDRNGVVSPDGRWLAYEATDSGPFEIYVRPLPDLNGGHWHVSTAGGTRPLRSVPLRHFAHPLPVQRRHDGGTSSGLSTGSQS